MNVTLQQVLQKVQLENWDGARADLLQVTQQHPNSAKGWYYLAQVDQHLGNIGEATMALNRADQIDPTHSYVGNVALYNQLRAQLATSNQTVLVNTQTDYSVTHPGEGSHPYAWGFVVLVLAAAVAYVISRMIKNGGIKKAALLAESEARNAKGKLDAKLDSFAAPLPQVNVTKSARSEHAAAVRQASTTTASRAAAVRATPARKVPKPYVPAPHRDSTVVNNYGSNNDGLLTGVVLGSLLSDHGHDRVVEATPTPSFDSGSRSTPSFDSSNKDDDSSSFDSGSRSSGFDFGSSSFDSGSSSSSSSWDSGSSSSFDSGSSSSFDSGSSSFDSGSSSSSDGW